MKDYKTFLKQTSKTNLQRFLFLFGFCLLIPALATNETAAQQTNQNQLVINFKSPPQSEVAGELNLDSPYRQYFDVVWSIRDDPDLKNRLLSYLSSAVSYVSAEKALTLSEFVTNPLYKIDALISIANAYIDSGNTELAQRILSLANRETKKISDELIINDKDSIKETITRYVGLWYDFQGPNDTLIMISEHKDPFLFGLLLSDFIARLGSPIEGLELSEQRISAPEAILDISYNRLETLHEKKDYLSNLLYLSSFYLGKNTESSMAKFSEITKLAKQLISSNPEVPSLENHKTIVSHMITLKQFDEATNYALNIKSIDTQAEVLSSLARSLYEIGETDKAIKLFITISKIVDNQIVDPEKREDLKQLLIGHLTEVGRLADSFDIILESEDEMVIANRASYMAKKLITSDKLKEAELLWKYIPYANPRAELLFEVAKHYQKNGDTAKANEYIVTALQENNFAKGIDGLEPDLLISILNYSRSVLSQEQFLSIFNIVKVRLLEQPTRLGIIFSELELLKNELQFLDSYEDTDEIKNITDRILDLSSKLWPYKSEKLYVPSLSLLVSLLAKLDQYQTALTLAASIPVKITDDVSLNASKEAISTVISETMDDGLLELAAKAFDSIPFESEKRATLLRILKTLAREPRNINSLL